MFYSRTNRLGVGNLNINSVPNKFYRLKLITQNKVDISLTTESKLASSFLDSKLMIDGLRKPHCLDRNVQELLCPNL